MRINGRRLIVLFCFWVCPKAIFSTKQNVWDHKTDLYIQEGFWTKHLVISQRPAAAKLIRDAICGAGQELDLKRLFQISWAFHAYRIPLANMLRDRPPLNAFTNVQLPSTISCNDCLSVRFLLWLSSVLGSWNLAGKQKNLEEQAPYLYIIGILNGLSPQNPPFPLLGTVLAHLNAESQQKNPEDLPAFHLEIVKKIHKFKNTRGATLYLLPKFSFVKEVELFDIATKVIPLLFIRDSGVSVGSFPSFKGFIKSAWLAHQELGSFKGNNRTALPGKLDDHWPRAFMNHANNLLSPPSPPSPSLFTLAENDDLAFPEEWEEILAQTQEGSTEETCIIGDPDALKTMLDNVIAKQSTDEVPIPAPQKTISQPRKRLVYLDPRTN